MIFVNTQMRVGSTWITELVCCVFGMDRSFWPHGGKISKRKFRNQGNGCVKLHWADPKTICEAIENRTNAYQLCLTRNIYDTIISSIFYMRYDKPLLKLKRLKGIKNLRISFGLENKNLSDKEFVNKFIQQETKKKKKRFIDPWLMYNSGYEHPKLLTVYYEEMKESVFKTMQKISDFLQDKRKYSRINKCIEKHSFQKKTGREPGKERTKQFRRNGTIGDYRKYMTKNSINIINNLTNHKMKRYPYEI